MLSNEVLLVLILTGWCNINEARQLIERLGPKRKPGKFENQVKLFQEELGRIRTENSRINE